MHRITPIIESERLILRMLSESDALKALAYYKTNAEHLMHSNPKWPENFFSESFWTKQIETNLKEFENDKSLRLFLFEKNDSRVVGHVSFGGILRSAAQFAYLGYGLAKDKVGYGYLSEILPPAIQYAFNELKIHRIMANYKPANERSANLLKKLGFTIEGYARDYLLLNGKWEDHILSSITNPNWNEIL